MGEGDEGNAMRVVVWCRFRQEGCRCERCEGVKYGGAANHAQVILSIDLGCQMVLCMEVGVDHGAM